MGRRPTACKKCAAIKANCAGRPTCSRCQRLGLKCSLSTNSKALLSVSPHASGEPPIFLSANNEHRARHTKSSSGCANCRRRRKKCDERWPTCGDCQRLHLQCLPRSETSSGPPVGHHDPIVNEDSGDEEEDDGTSPIANWLDIINNENTADLSYPLSSLAHSSALQVLPDRRASDTDPPEEGVTLPPVALSNHAGINPATQDGWTTGERHLLNHFLHSVARSMSMVEDKYNPFIRLIVPLAFESTAVRNALAALSATHLSKVYPDFERNHLLHRNMALEDLKWRLESPETSLSALTATLLLCLGEVCTSLPRPLWWRNDNIV